MSANEKQHGGSHYKQFGIQPWDAINEWGLGYLDGCAVKYISRWRHKNGIEDLNKAIHFLEKLREQQIALQSQNEKILADSLLQRNHITQEMYEDLQRGHYSWRDPA